MASPSTRALIHLTKLRAALKPFAAIKPSSLYPEDGSEMEEYTVLLRGPHSNPLAFTGLDLALAREACEMVPPEGAQYIEQLEFFCAILLAVSVNRIGNLEMLENYVRGLKPTNR